MQSYKQAHMMQKGEIQSFLEAHLLKPTQQSKDIFDFLLIKFTKEVILFFRKNQSKYPNLSSDIDSTFNEGFTREYILWMVFSQKIPNIYDKFDYYKVINKPIYTETPVLNSIYQVLKNGDEQTIAELILKSVDILSQIQNIDFQNELSKNDQNIVDNLQKFNILYDERVAITQYSNQCISANPNKIYDLLKNLIDNNVLKKIMSNFNFIQRFDYSDIEESLGDFICDEDIEFAYKEVVNVLITQDEEIPKETILLLNQVKISIIQQSPLLFAKFLTIISSSTHQVFFFDESKLKIQCVQINYQLLLENEQQFNKLKTIIFDIFVQNKDLLNQLLSITSPEIILQLSIEFYPHIDLPQLLMLRTYQDGPQFINQFLLLATNDISKIQYELVYFILEFASKIIWLYDESPVFQSVSCQNTSKLLENFVTDANDHFGCNLLDTKLLGNVHNLIQKPAQNVISFVRQFNFDVSVVEKYLFGAVKDEDQINIDLILQEVMVMASFIIADSKEQIDVRTKFFVFIVQMLDKYEIFMSSALQASYFMKESGWHQIIMLNIVKIIQYYNGMDNQTLVQNQATDADKQLQQKISKVNEQLAQLNTKLQQNILLAQQQPENKLQLSQRTKQLMMDKIQLNKVKNQLISQQSTTIEGTINHNQTYTSSKPPKCLLQYFGLLLQCKQIKNMSYILNILGNISQFSQSNKQSFYDVDQFKNIVTKNIPSEKIVQNIKLSLNKIIPLTAFDIGVTLKSQYADYTDYLIQFVILDRLVVDQDISLLKFLEGFAGQQNVAKYLLNNHIIPIFNYIFPRFTLLRFTFSNNIEVINQSPMLYDSSEISFRYPKSHNSLISIEINQIAKIASFLVQKIEVDSSIDYLVQNLIYYHSFAIDMINGIYFQKYTEFIRVFLQPILVQSKQQLVFLLNNIQKLQYFINPLSGLKTLLIDQLQFDQINRDFSIICFQDAYVPGNMSVFTLQSISQHLSENLYLRNEVTIYFEETMNKLCSLLVGCSLEESKIFQLLQLDHQISIIEFISPLLLSEVMFAILKLMQLQQKSKINVQNIINTLIRNLGATE